MSVLRFAADADPDRALVAGVPDRKRGQSDRFVEGWTHRPAGDLAESVAVGRRSRVSAPGDTPLVKHDTGGSLGGSLVGDNRQRIDTGDPPSSHLEPRKCRQSDPRCWSEHGGCGGVVQRLTGLATTNRVASRTGRPRGTSHVQTVPSRTDERTMRASRELEAGRRSALPLRVDSLGDDTVGPATAYCTDIEGTELRVAIQDASTANLARETGEWYRFDGVVRSDSPGAELLCPSGDGSVERIVAPEQQSYPPPADLDDPWLVRLNASNKRVAVTVQPRPTDGMERLRVDEPETFEIGAVCFADCAGSGDTAVYHREEPDTQDEHHLLEHVVRDLSELEGAALVTRGNSPLGMLHARLALAAEGDIIDAGAQRALEGCFHADLTRVVVRAETDTLETAARQVGIETSPVSLDDYDIGSDPADWREDWAMDTVALPDVSDPRMSDRDYATLVERYLGAEGESAELAQLSRCLKRYASADLDLLCALVTEGATDRLGCPQLAGRHLVQST
jgi:hypothetical protein